MRSRICTAVAIIAAFECVGGPAWGQNQPPSGTAWAWGSNGYGQLGNGTTANSNLPLQVSGLTSIVSVARGGGHSLALKSDGTVWAWGYNAVGQLGNGTNMSSSVPVLVSNLNSVVAIAGGGSHSLALKSDGTVWAWGFNGYGQLGNGTFADSNVPVQVSGFGNVVAVAAGNDHSLALKSDGTVWAWGDNTDGQLGNYVAGAVVPIQVSSVSGIVAVAGGGNHSLALDSYGAVWAWGYGVDGELGNGANTNSYVAVPVSNLGSVVAVAGGGAHSLALKADGTVWAWGNNNAGQLGSPLGPLFLPNSNVPVQVSQLNRIVAIAGGQYHSLALKSDGTAWGWGYNLDGELGVANNINSNVPQEGLAPPSCVGIGPGPTAFHSLAIVAPLVSLSLDSMDFGVVAVGQTSAPSMLTITNNGPGPLVITNLALGGANPGDFTFSGPVLPATISVGSSIGVNVYFAPTASGSRAATLLIADNGFEGPHQVSLAGTGIISADVAIALAASPNPVRTTTDLTYTITVLNGGPSPATSVSVSDSLPSGTAFVSVKTSQGGCLVPGPGSFTLTCSLGNVASRASATITIVVQVIAPGSTTITNTAIVSASSPDPNPANNSATVSTSVFGRP